MTDPLDHILKLAREIGARPSTGEGERRAAAYIEDQLRRFGFTVRVEPFRSVRSSSHTYILILMLALAGFLAAATLRPGWGLLLSGIAMVAFLGENTTALHLANALLPKRKSQNVVARLAAREMPRRRLILCAHYDSAKSGPMWHPWVVRRYRQLFIAEVAAVVALPILLGAEALTGRGVFLFIAVPVVTYIVVTLLLLVVGQVAYKYVEGAGDNASGVGVMLSLCEALAADAPADTEVMAVATGCQEAGGVGVQKFLAAHAEDLQRAMFINIDSVGAGEVSYTTSEGTLLPHRTAKGLVNIAEKVAAQPGLRVVGRPFHAASTDAGPVLLHRVDALSVIATRDGVPVNWRWKTDTLENIDPDTIDTAYRFVEALVRRLIA